MLQGDCDIYAWSIRLLIDQVYRETVILSEEMLLIALCPRQKELHFLKLGKGKTRRKMFSFRSLDEEFGQRVLFVHVFI